MNRKIKTLPPLEIPLDVVTINRDTESRIDKYRANTFSPTTLHHATLKDSGDHPIPVVAKVRRNGKTDRQTYDRMRMRAKRHLFCE